MNDYNSIYKQEAMTLPPVTETKKKAPSFTRTEYVMACVLLLCGFFVVRFGVVHPTGLITTLLYWGLLTVELVFLHRAKLPFNTTDKLLAVTLFLFAGVYTITANELIKFLNTVFLIMADGLLLFRLGNDRNAVMQFLPLSLLRSVFELPFSRFSMAFSAAISGTKGKKFWKHAAYVLIGLVMTVPLTAIVATLLIDADDTMSVMLGNFLSACSPEETVRIIVQFLIGLLVGAAMFSALYCTNHGTAVLHADRCEEQLTSCRIIPGTILYAAVTPICVLYLMFFFSQMQYFMGGFTGETSGYTYAGYAQQGFFQLCTVCCINLAVIAGMGFFISNTGKKPLALRLYSCYLCICSVFLAGTAMAKMFMYIHVYGLTPLRLYTTWFMVLLVIGFMTIFLRQFLHKLPVGKIGAAAFILMFGLLCFSRPDALIARCNAEMYLTGQIEEFDTSLLYSLSDDAAAVLSSYSPEEQEQLDVTHYLLDADRGRGFYRSLNLSALMCREQ